MKDIEEMMDESNYDTLPEQANKTVTWTSRDKKTVFEWKTIFNIAGQRESEQTINVEGHTNKSKNPDTSVNLFESFITDSIMTFMIGQKEEFMSWICW